MYKSRRGVDRSKRDSCFFSPLGSGNLAQIPRWQEGSLPAVRAGVLGNSPQVGNGARGGDWLMRAHLGPTSRSFYSQKLCLYLQLSAPTAASRSSDEAAQSQMFPIAWQPAGCSSHVGPVQWAGLSFPWLPTYSPKTSLHGALSLNWVC